MQRRKTARARPAPDSIATLFVVARNAGAESTEPNPNPRALVGLGFEIAVPVVLCSFAGFQADRWLDTEPWLVVTGALIGSALGFYGFFRRVRSRGRGENGR